MGTGNGVTELIAACAFNDSTNGVGRFSFTHALIGQLSKLSHMPFFTVGYLYNLLFTEIQGWRKEDTRHKKAPVHIILTQDHRLPRSIKLSSKRSSLGGRKSSTLHDTGSGSQLESSPENPPGTDNVISPFSSDVASSMSSLSTLPEFPRLLFSVRINENIRYKDLCAELFADWLGTIPIATKHVRVEAGFASDSTLLMVSMPVGFLGYLPEDPAITMLGITRSTNLLILADDNLTSEGTTLPDPFTSHQVEMKDEKCCCYQFELDQGPASNACDCGYPEFHHSQIGRIENPDSEDLKEKISGLREQIDHVKAGERVSDDGRHELDETPDEKEAGSDTGPRSIRSPPGKGKAIESPIQEHISGHGLIDKFEVFAKAPWSDDEEDGSNIKIKVKKGCSRCERSIVYGSKKRSFSIVQLANDY